jgi:hypothetical protein
VNKHITAVTIVIGLALVLIGLVVVGLHRKQSLKKSTKNMRKFWKATRCGVA